MLRYALIIILVLINATLLVSAARIVGRNIEVKEREEKMKKEAEEDRRLYGHH